MMLKSSFLLILAAAVNAAESPIDGRIVNGRDASIADYPYQVAIFLNAQQWCGGSIVGPKHVLTAAHCTLNRNATPFSVRVGSSFPFKGGQTIKVIEIIQHEAYNRAIYDNDVSLLVLKEAIIFNAKAQSVTLAAVEPSNKWCNVTGWGHHIESGKSSDLLQVAQVPIIPRNICNKMYGRDRVSNLMICAGFGNGRRDTCQGDSGGPLVCDGVQVGVVSWGEGCTRATRPGVYSNIAALKPWIKKHSKI